METLSARASVCSLCQHTSLRNSRRPSPRVSTLRRSAAAASSSEPPGEEPAAPRSAYPRVNSLTALWKSDVEYVGERGKVDTKRAKDGLAFWRELLVAAFGRGERPALQAELERLRAELASMRQQVRNPSATQSASL